MRRIEGFSLLELVLVIVILGILVVFVGPVLYNAMRSYAGIQVGAVTNVKVRYAMERISREMRDIRRQATDSAYLDIRGMSASSMAFFKSDGSRVVLNVVGGNVVNLEYLPAGGSTLTGMLLDQVQPGSFALSYFQQNNAAAATITAQPSTTTQQVSFVQVSMSIVDGTNTFPARLRVDLRNPQ
jgi:prepilin-type N-terminal cleavage/methylation domain-containing protein